MSPCNNCHSGCCRSFAVPVSGADIIRIETQLELSFWDFVCRWADPEGQIARNHAPHFHFADEADTPFVICMTHQNSTFFPSTTKCRFLVEGEPDETSPLGQARCGIYHQRPGACRAFPVRLNETSELVILSNIPERGRGTDEPQYELCPRPWEKADLDSVNTMGDLVTSQFEMKFFHRLAEVWNRSPRPWAAFPDFLHLVYSARVVDETESSQPAAAHAAPTLQPTVPRLAESTAGPDSGADYTAGGQRPVTFPTQPPADDLRRAA
ncbi:MAG: YkgJ family cysteine cluster protein [Planctomycetaceae bacterium]|nr:YkgJ family cysteine cluster protein [Planctomycetaceae bacterium]